MRILRPESGRDGGRPGAGQIGILGPGRKCMVGGGTTLQSDAQKGRNRFHLQIETRTSGGVRSWLEVSSQLPKLMTYVRARLHRSYTP